MWTDLEINRRVVVEKVSLLVGSFPNAAPHNPEAYTGMMVEEIIAANPTVSALEATCRELRRTKTFPPSIAEMLKELWAQAEMFHATEGIYEDDIEYIEKKRDKMGAAHDALVLKAREAAE
jgi:hypothetical protein